MKIKKQGWIHGCPRGVWVGRGSDNKSSKDRTRSAVLDALHGVISSSSRVGAGQRPLRADVLKDSGVNFFTSIYPKMTKFRASLRSHRAYFRPERTIEDHRGQRSQRGLKGLINALRGLI